MRYSIVDAVILHTRLLLSSVVPLHPLFTLVYNVSKYMEQMTKADDFLDTSCLHFKG